MRQLLPFLSGVLLVALLLGFLVGASSSPIAGAAVTAVFGLLAAALAFVQVKEIGEPGASTRIPTKGAGARRLSVSTLNSLGWCLVLFCIAFSTGLAAGVWARNAHSAQRSQVTFPWRGGAAPASIRVAVDWIAVKRALTSVGYSDAQIEELYRMSGNGLVPQDLFRSHPNSDLLSPILSDGGKSALTGSIDKKPTLIVDQPAVPNGRNPS